MIARLFCRLVLAVGIALAIASPASADVPASRHRSFEAPSFDELPRLDPKATLGLNSADRAKPECVALCEFAATVDADPFGYGSTPRPFDGRPTPFGRQYFYAANNPTLFIDPTGHAAIDYVTDGARSVYGFGKGVVKSGYEFGAGIVKLGVKAAEVDYRLKFGTFDQKREALGDIGSMVTGAGSHLVQSGQLLYHGVTNPGDVVAAAAQLGPEGTGEAIGGASFDAALLMAPGAKGVVVTEGRAMTGVAKGAGADLFEGAGALVRGPRPPVGRIIEMAPDSSGQWAMAEQPLARGLPPSPSPMALPGVAEIKPSFVVDEFGRTATLQDLRALARARQARLQPGATSNTIGKAGEDALDALLRGRGTPQVSRAALGTTRIFDRLLDGIGVEIKNTLRPQSNSSFFRRQVAKEKALLGNGAIRGSVFIGLRGFTGPASRGASAAGIDVWDLRNFPDIRDFPFN